PGRAGAPGRGQGARRDDEPRRRRGITEGVTPDQLRAARAARGFMPDREGLALHQAGLEAATVGPLLEVGGYCGKSALYLGAAAAEAGTVLFSVDHHRGSEENQPGWEHHDPEVVDPRSGRIDTLPHFRRTIEEAGWEAV